MANPQHGKRPRPGTHPRPHPRPGREPARTPSGRPGQQQLQRRLGVFDSTAIGLGSMLGAGVFVVFAPAAALAGPLLTLAVAVAGVIAYCNAVASAQLAAKYPSSGGTYVYGRRQLGEWPGFIAGWGFVTGKTASCAAMALTFGHYLAPGFATPAADAAAAGTAGGQNVWGVLPAAGLIFFAFAGYARIATLGEEVKDPGRTIPRAILAALGGAFVIYLGLAALLQWQLPAAQLA